MKQVAKRLAAQGRQGDTELVHMSKGEVRALHGIASLAGRKLTKNPKTGLPEAFNLFDILPFALNFIFPGMGTLAQVGIGALSGAASSAIEGNDPLTGALTGGAMGGIGSLFGGAENAAVQGAANQAGNIAGQGATALGQGAEAAASAINPETIARSVTTAGLPESGSGLLGGTGLEGGGFDRWLADPFSKGNLPWTIGGGAALASLLPTQGLDVKDKSGSGANVKPPAQPRTYHAPPPGYLAGYDPEWQYFTPNPGPYFQGDPNYLGYSGGGPVADAMSEALRAERDPRSTPRSTVNTNEPSDGIEPMLNDDEFRQFMHRLGMEARRRAHPTATQREYDRQQRLRSEANIAAEEALKARVADELAAMRAGGIYGLGASVENQTLPIERTGHVWDQGITEPVSGGAWSSGPQVSAESVQEPSGPVVRMPVQMPQYLPGRLETPWQAAPEPNLGDAEAYYQDKINEMHKRLNHLSRDDRERYDYYVNMRDVERGKKTGKRINPRFDPGKLHAENFSRGGIACYAPGGGVQAQRASELFSNIRQQLANFRSRDSSTPRVPAGAWWRGDTTSPSAQPTTTPTFTPRDPSSLIANNFVAAPPSIQPTLFQPVTGMAGGGLASMSGAKQAIMQQLMGRQVPGHGMGMDDDVPAQIDGHEPAALSSGEYVVPADAVSMLGDGNSAAGAKQLEAMISRIRMVKTGKAKQASRINPKRVMPA